MVRFLRSLFRSDGDGGNPSDLNLDYKGMDDEDEDEEETLDDSADAKGDTGTEDDGDESDVEDADGSGDDSEDAVEYDKQGYDKDGFNKDGYHRLVEQLPDRYKQLEFIKGAKSFGEIIDRFQDRGEAGPLPASADEYNLDPVDLGALAADKKVMDRFTETMFAAKLDNDQAVAVQKFINAEVRAGLKAVDRANEKAIAETKEHYAEEWGNDYDKKMEYVAAGTEYLGKAKFANWLDDSGMGNDTVMVDALYKIGRLTTEDPLFGRMAPGARKKDAARLARSPIVYKSMDGMYDEDDDEDED